MRNRGIGCNAKRLVPCLVRCRACVATFKTMTTEQKDIIQWAKFVGGKFTKSEAVARFGVEYYHNGAFHVGERLSRMVKSGHLVRVQRGVYKVGKGTKSNPAKIDADQTSLF